MKINIITLYPEYFDSNILFGTIKKALDIKAFSLNIINLRDYAYDKRGSVDDTPYGGGAGMIIRADVLYKALESTKKTSGIKGYTVVLSASGEKYTQNIAESLVKLKEITIVCPRYEGFDERILEYADIELSIGDFVLSGGEPAALVIIDSISRLLPKVLGNVGSLEEESFSGGNKNLLEYPQYTRPEEFNGLVAPKVLLSGNHEEIKEWRNKKSIEKTHKNRPDLI
jgi:tRNA (guanine37-N1)-methyltransferase